MFRLPETNDTPSLIHIATETGAFKPVEIVALKEVLDDYHATNKKLGHRAIIFEDDTNHLLGFAYYVPIPLTNNTWDLYWIFVSKETQGKGVGAKLLQYVESDLKNCGARLLVLSTSSLPHYDFTRRFYQKHGYSTSTSVRDYYAEGDDLLIYSKHFSK